MDVIEETVGLHRIKEHSHLLTLALDLVFFDGGLPLLPSKPLLLALLTPPSTTQALLTKAAAQIDGSTSHSVTDELARALKEQ